MFGTNRLLLHTRYRQAREYQNCNFPEQFVEHDQNPYSSQVEQFVLQVILQHRLSNQLIYH